MTPTTFKISKIDEDQRLVFGYANVSIAKGTGDLIDDLQEDIVEPHELEKMAYGFVLDFREADEMHKGGAIGQLVESMVFTDEKLEKLATKLDGTVDEEVFNVLKAAIPPRWWVGFKLEKAVFEKVKSGKYRMFSIAGDADRIPA